MAAVTGLRELSSVAPTTDLLSRFGVAGCHDATLTDRVSEGEIELGLSLGGCFEAEPEKNRLLRASSISGLSMYDKKGVVQPIVKTYSQPKEGKEELRKRKAGQSLNRLETKQRRLEKRKSRTGAKHDHGAVDGLSMLRSIYQRSVGSQGSSDLSDFDCRLEHGSNNCKEVKTLSGSISLSINQANIKIPTEDKQSKKMLNEANLMISMEENKQSKEKFEIENKAKELVRSRMEEKPFVSTQGDGPNGRMIQGLLYKYENGMDVRIVCVCHGRFLTPAEFVKHAGGDDVAHPLRHILVSPHPC